MKKVCTLFLGLAALAFATPTVMAEDVYVKIDHNNPDINIIRGSGSFDKVNLLLGSVSEDIVVDLGEFDFDSNDFQAAYFDFANSWSAGTLLLSAGDTFDSATPLVKIPLETNFTYYLPRRFGQNFGYQVDNFVAPSGKKHIYASSAGGGIGNFIGIGFKETQFTEADYYNNETTVEPFEQAFLKNEDNGKRLLWPNENPEWDDKSIIVKGADFERTGGDGTDNPGGIDSDGSIGWTGSNLEMTSKGKVDFGSNRFNQIVIQTKMGTWNASVNLNKFMEVYIDEVAEDNRIGRVWFGLEAWRDNTFVPLVCNMEQEVTGEHKVIIKWGQDGSNNVMNVGFYEGNEWPISPIPDPSVYPVIAQPAEGAMVFNFVQEEGNTRQDVDGNGDDAKIKIYNNDWKCEILNKGKWEGNNIGYTGNGSIFRITAADGSKYNFGNHNYSGVIIKYGAGGDAYGQTPEESNIRLYVDLDEYNELDWTRPEEYYDAGNDFAEVKMEHTGGWDPGQYYYSPIKDPSMLQGQHKLFVSMTNTRNNDAGANIKAIYFIERTGVNGEIAEITDGFTVTFEENVDLVNADAISVKATSETDINGLTPEVTVNKNVVTVSLADYPGGAYVVTIPEASVNVGVNYFNNVVEQEVATWDAIKAITIAHDQDGLFELSGGEEAELTLNVETVNGKAYDPETEFEVECANNAASHVSAEVKDDVVLVTVAETAVKSDSPVAITLKAGDVTSNAVELNHYAAPTTVVLGGTQDEFVEANNTITIADDSEALNYTIALNEGAYQKFLFAAEDNECAAIVLTDNGLTITPKAEGTTQFSITPLKAGEFKNDSDPTTPATTYTVVVSHTVGVQIFNANGEEVEIFNLQGVKVANPQNGIFIINGKKVLVK